MKNYWLLPLLLLALSAPLRITAQATLPTKEDVEREIRRRWRAFNSGNVDSIVQNSQEGVGFGWRSAALRSTAWAGLDSSDVVRRGASAFRERTKRFLDSMEYYRGDIEELHTFVDGNIGFAWGVWVESFKPKGRPAESARVRFTQVLKKEGDHWRPLLYHRDIQPFDENGRYLTRFTVHPEK